MDRLNSQGFMNTQEGDVLSLGEYKINNMYGTQDEEAQMLIENKKGRSKIRVHSTKGQREIIVRNNVKNTTGNNFYSGNKTK